jgi:hypothetical protein
MQRRYLMLLFLADPREPSVKLVMRAEILRLREECRQAKPLRREPNVTVFLVNSREKLKREQNLRLDVPHPNS